MSVRWRLNTDMTHFLLTRGVSFVASIRQINGSYALVVRTPWGAGLGA